MLVQGIIDVFFQEGDRCVILDYKTDRVREAASLRTRYRDQLDLYREAVTRITGITCIEKTIYAFQLGEVVIF